MNSKVYKWCAVPQCVNTSLKTPDKLFVYVPNKKTMRYKWLNLARRDPKAISVSSSIYFCEDHFDLPNDMDNYMEYHVMGTVSQVRMKPRCIPTKFQCQSERKRTITTERPYFLKKQRRTLIEESIKDLEEKSITTNHLKLGEMSSESSDQSSAFHPQVDIKTEIEEIEIKSEPIDSLNDYLIDVDRVLKPSSDFDIPVNNSSDFSEEMVFKLERIYESTNDLPADPLQYIQPISTKNEEDMTAQSNLSSDAPTVNSNTNSAIFEDPYFKRVHKPLRLALSRFFPLETAMFREKFEDNEDLLFILTLLADIKCVNKVDRLDLKADVLNVVKRYRNK